MYATAIVRESMNSDLSQYIAIHRNERSISKIRKNCRSIALIYTIDIFLKYTYIHHEASPSITVT